MKTVALLITLMGPQANLIKVPVSQLPFDPFILRSSLIVEQATKRVGKFLTSHAALAPMTFRGFEVIERMGTIPKEIAQNMFSFDTAKLALCKPEESLLERKKIEIVDQKQFYFTSKLHPVSPAPVFKGAMPTCVEPIKDTSLFGLFLSNNRELLKTLRPSQPKLLLGEVASDNTPILIVAGDVSGEREMVRFLFFYRKGQQEPWMVLSFYESGNMAIFGPADAQKLLEVSGAAKSLPETGPSAKSALQVVHDVALQAFSAAQEVSVIVSNEQVVRHAVELINKVLKELEQDFKRDVTSQLQDITKLIEPLRSLSIHSLFSAINNAIRALKRGDIEDYTISIATLKNAAPKDVKPLRKNIDVLEHLASVRMPVPLKLEVAKIKEEKPMPPIKHLLKPIKLEPKARLAVPTPIASAEIRETELPTIGEE